MKFRLMAVEEVLPGEGPAIHTSEFSAEFLPDVLMNIEMFLRGCGFYIKNLDYDAY